MEGARRLPPAGYAAAGREADDERPLPMIRRIPLSAHTVPPEPTMPPPAPPELPTGVPPIGDPLPAPAPPPPTPVG